VKFIYSTVSVLVIIYALQHENTVKYKENRKGARERNERDNKTSELSLLPQERQEKNGTLATKEMLVN
jgi:hypothetical protein